MNAGLFVSVVSCVLALAAAPACANGSTNGSNASSDLSAASGMIVRGSVQAFSGLGQMVVSSVEMAGESVVVVLRGMSEAVPVSVQLSAAAIGGVSIAVGTVIQVTAESTGYLLTAAGRVIAYIPNEIGRSLLHRSRYQQ
jgi:hypothetical protein